MIKGTFGLTETGSVRSGNQDNFLIDTQAGLLAVADGLGGLPHGDRASRMAVEILRHKLLDTPRMPLLDLLMAVNEETREIGFGLDESGFGTTLTMARFQPAEMLMEIAHIGDSAAYLVRNKTVHILTTEHTVAARMVASQWEEACEAIPPSAHHTLTQCIGQDLYIDPQILEVRIQPGDRLFLFTDGVVKPLKEAALQETICSTHSLERICQSLTFHIEVAGSPDNYTIVAAEF